jgi:hypothetical protein
MPLERHASLVVGLMTLIVLVLTPALMFRAPTHPWLLRAGAAEPITDTRERVRLTPAERDTILVEMRTMLESLSGIMQGLVAGDLIMAQKAARASGAVMVVDPSLERKLPPGFRQLGIRTHKRFDGLADAIKTGATRDAILRRVAAITASCVTCHATYRLDEMRE